MNPYILELWHKKEAEREEFRQLIEHIAENLSEDKRIQKGVFCENPPKNVPKNKM